MIERRVAAEIAKQLEREAAVALIGPRQVGKTTTALAVARDTGALYLDLETRRGREDLGEAPEELLMDNADRLVILDEVHHVPELFKELRGIIDRGRRGEGKPTGRFLILGSASLDLWRQSESLAGRITYVHMSPLNVLEIENDEKARAQLWLRGGYPASYLAPDSEASIQKLENLKQACLQRDIPEFGKRLPASTVEDLLVLLAHRHGGTLNASRIANGMKLKATTVSSYVGLLTDLLLLRRLRPLHRNLGKNLTRSPKVYVRDSGLLHSLLEIFDRDQLRQASAFGLSWESFVIENLLAVAPQGTRSYFYRTYAGAEIDLILEHRKLGRWAIEIKYGVADSMGRGFHEARKDLKPARTFVVHSGPERYPLADGVEAISLRELAEVLAALD